MFWQNFGSVRPALPSTTMQILQQQKGWWMVGSEGSILMSFGAGKVFDSWIKSS
jgi:hypothetical protein